MRYVALKRGAVVASLLMLLSAQTAFARQSGAAVTKEEEAEARAAASAFAARLLETHDFGAVVREMYAEDFASRRVKGWTSSEAAGSTFMLEGVPSLTFARPLAEDAGEEDWRRLYVAAADLMNFVYVSMMSRQSLKDLDDPEKYDERSLFEVFPPEALKVLGENRALSNFLVRRGNEFVIKTPAELRAAASALEEAVRLSRPRFVRALAEGGRLGENMRLMKEASAKDAVSSASDDAEALGYAKGARLFRVFAPNGYMLLLVKQGGAMKVAWATLPHD